MAYVNANNASRPRRASRLAAPPVKNTAGLFCYVGFALAFGFAVAVVLGLVH